MPPPRELPCQALDHGTGYLMACGIMLARGRQAREGGSWHVQVSLARTGRWLWELGRVAGGFDVTAPVPGPTDLESSATPFGVVTGVRHPARLAQTPAALVHPAVPPGHDPPHWPEPGFRQGV